MSSTLPTTHFLPAQLFSRMGFIRKGLHKFQIVIQWEKSQVGQCKQKANTTDLWVQKPLGVISQEREEKFKLCF